MIKTCLIFPVDDVIELVIGPDGDSFPQIKNVDEFSEVQI